jgi:hypothetical protein
MTRGLPPPKLPASISEDAMAGVPATTLAPTPPPLPAAACSEELEYEPADVVRMDRGTEGPSAAGALGAAVPPALGVRAGAARGRGIAAELAAGTGALPADAPPPVAPPAAPPPPPPPAAAALPA